MEENEANNFLPPRIIAIPFNNVQYGWFQKWILLHFMRLNSRASRILQREYKVTSLNAKMLTAEQLMSNYYFVWRRQPLENRSKFHDIKSSFGPLSPHHRFGEARQVGKIVEEKGCRNKASEIRQICSKHLSFN